MKLTSQALPSSDAFKTNIAAHLEALSQVRAAAEAAALGGGVFGDHCSPTSDTSIITSMATANDHIDHVRTQLPYALIGGAITTGIYLILGVVGV